MEKCYSVLCPFATKDKRCPCIDMCPGYIDHPIQVKYETSTKEDILFMETNSSTVMK